MSDDFTPVTGPLCPECGADGDRVLVEDGEGWCLDCLSSWETGQPVDER